MNTFGRIIMNKLHVLSIYFLVGMSVNISVASAETTLNDFRNAVVNQNDKSSNDKSITTEELLEKSKNDAKPPVVNLDGFEQGVVGQVSGSGNTAVDKQLSDAFNVVDKKKSGVAQVTEVKKSRFTELKYNSNSINRDTNLGVKKELEFADKLSRTIGK